MFMSGSTRAPTHLTGRDIQLCDSESPLLPALQVLSWRRAAKGSDQEGRSGRVGRGISPSPFQPFALISEDLIHTGHHLFRR